MYYSVDISTAKHKHKINPRGDVVFRWIDWRFVGAGLWLKTLIDNQWFMGEFSVVWWFWDSDVYSLFAATFLICLYHIWLGGEVWFLCEEEKRVVGWCRLLEDNLNMEEYCLNLCCIVGLCVINDLLKI